VRFNGKTREEKKPKPPKKVGKGRHPNTIITRADNVSKAVDFTIIADELNETEMAALIDYGAELDAEAKEHNRRVKIIKDLLRINADIYRWKNKAGNTATAGVSPSSKTTIDATAMGRLLARLGKSNLFGTIFSVKITEAKKYVGIDDLDEISETETKEFGRVSLKLLK
jgi:hypothetical protein